MKVCSQDPVAVSLRGTDDVGISYAQVTALRVVYQHRLGIAVIIFVQFAPGQAVFAVAEENLFIPAGSIKIGPQVARGVISVQILRHRLYGYGEFFCCRLSVKRNIRRQCYLFRRLSGCRTGHLAAVIKAVLTHGLICDHIRIAGGPVDDSSVGSLFYQGQIAPDIIGIFNSKGVCRFLKQTAQSCHCNHKFL